MKDYKTGGFYLQQKGDRGTENWKGGKIMKIFIMRVSHKKCNRAEELCMHQKERKILKTITILMQVLKDQRKKK